MSCCNPRRIFALLLLLGVISTIALHHISIIKNQFLADFELLDDNPTFSAKNPLNYRSNSSSKNQIVSPATSQAKTTKFSAGHSFRFDREHAEAALRLHGVEPIRRTLAAYIEAPLNDTIPGTGSLGNLTNYKEPGYPPDFWVPLPLRTQTPNDLIKYEYKRVQTCHDIPSKFPVDRGLQLDENGKPILWNIVEEPLPDDFPIQEAPFCPVDADPFLPWIHDVFPSLDGSKIHFIAHNKRRCRTGRNFTKEVTRMVPQVALAQPISVERIDEVTARRLAPTLWQPSDKTSIDVQHPRYRLAPRNESSSDGQNTRFICRFHATDFSSPGAVQSIYLGETLSDYPFNYEFVAYRQGSFSNPLMITPKGKDAFLIWVSTIHFHCPVPEIPATADTACLRSLITSGESVLSDGTATLHVDLVPIRTSTRYNETYLTEEEIGPKDQWLIAPFDPSERWGPRNVLPVIEASGRWENIPICKPPSVDGVEPTKPTRNEASKQQDTAEKPHYLTACVWASAEFVTRGAVDGANNEVIARLIEWIEFHLLVGFDQIYLYDNSGANSKTVTLANVAEKFPGKVTRIDWPSVLCNNNLAQHDSMGEWSSQYAAETSCRARFSPFTEWIGTLDADEYLVPMGNHTNLKEMLRRAKEEGVKILSFRSSRGLLRPKSSFFENGTKPVKRSNVTFLEAYNCDSTGDPKPSWTANHRKEIYLADYVRNHFVHFTLATNDTLQTYSSQADGKWKRRFKSKTVVERNTNETTEGLMVHARKVDDNRTSFYKQLCHRTYKPAREHCAVAFPWPNRTFSEVVKFGENQLYYNCFENQRVEDYWVPKLEQALKKRHHPK